MCILAQLWFNTLCMTSLSRVSMSHAWFIPYVYNITQTSCHCTVVAHTLTNAVLHRLSLPSGESYICIQSHALVSLCSWVSYKMRYSKIDEYHCIVVIHSTFVYCHTDEHRWSCWVRVCHAIRAHTPQHSRNEMVSDMPGYKPCRGNTTTHPLVK